MVGEEITALEALGIAIRSEMDAQEVYKDLASMCEEELMRDKFLNMYHEERKHQALLEKMYKEMFPEVDLALPSSRLAKDVEDSRARRKHTIKEILQLAIIEEKKSREFYLDCAGTVTDLSGKRMFRFLADMEFSHQALLNAELELLEKYPAYFEGQKPWEVESRLRTDKIKRREN
jgi:rubrerythrin